MGLNRCKDDDLFKENSHYIPSEDLIITIDQRLCIASSLLKDHNHGDDLHTATDHWWTKTRTKLIFLKDLNIDLNFIQHISSKIRQLQSMKCEHIDTVNIDTIMSFLHSTCPVMSSFNVLHFLEFT